VGFAMMKAGNAAFQLAGIKRRAYSLDVSSGLLFIV